MNKLLIDTNLFVYALNDGSKYFESTMEILRNPAFSLYTTNKNISEYFAVTSKLNVDKKLILKNFSDIEKYVTILFPTIEVLKYLKNLQFNMS